MIISDESFNKINKRIVEIIKDKEEAGQLKDVNWVRQFDMLNKLIREIKNALPAYDVRKYNQMTLDIQENIDNMSREENVLRSLKNTDGVVSKLLGKIASLGYFLHSHESAVVNTSEVDRIYSHIQEIDDKTCRLDYVKELADLQTKTKLAEIAFYYNAERGELAYKD